MPKEVQYSQSDLVNKIIENAVESRASDIHIDPTKTELIIRYRIDGTLHAAEKLSRSISEELISRIKVLAQMNITEKRYPQDGHFEYEYDSNVLNIRVSTYPAVNGEAVAMRLLNSERMLMPLKTMGMADDQYEIMSKLIKNPYGMILVTGPTGSGKSTLLYSILNTYNRVSNNMITIEDPVELRMEGMRQLQVNETLDLSFANAMRAVLRQDPDILMIGEIRDNPTADMAFQAALTGRLVYSTFHTYDLPSLVTRFHEMGVPFTVISQALMGTMSKRLLRKICDNCTRDYEPKPEELAFIGDYKLKTSKKGEGCQKCMASGYYGRTGLFEIIPFDDELRSYILERKSPAEVNRLLKEKNIKTLKEAAIEKVENGETSLEEINRVLGV